MHSHHGHNHNHSHIHNHSGSDSNAASSRRIGWVFLLNFGFTIVEFIGGWLTNSTAIMADAVHDLGDSFSLGIAWLLNKLAGRKPDQAYTYGYHRFSLLGALINGVLLVAGSVWVLSEAIPRLASPQMPHAPGMVVFAVFGVIVNGYAAYRLSAGTTLNERVLNWHLLEDVLGWLAVLIVALVLVFIDLPILDPILSIAFTLFILFNVAKALREALSHFLQVNPDQAMHREIVDRLTAMEDVIAAHHVHFWSLDGERHVLTAHLVIKPLADNDSQLALKHKLSEILSRYPLAHTTIEFEFEQEQCRDGQP